ncbi:hypothetical protein sscle_02g019070 [Sclerotinia sclerotiorum 1980 UF-70]|uniref:Major facilitator superfamily (MFS) profile domain-containing protein n=1 Tax=Sclerotinia sclerotiorum (strain ATCC 18683 / 1980 / Ss-1) TaxID=665079 RepID=A0A1D9PWR7_SCLS1|nr:hypothetical protein sscle_02g019070 [Sclerotinia sclerotiorum 1980 UF-70]
MGRQLEIHDSSPFTRNDVDVEKVENNVRHDDIRTTGQTDADLVEFAPNDPENPLNWASWRKWSIVLSLTIANFSCLWVASGYSPAIPNFQQKFGTSAEVATLPLVIYVLGLGFGPMLLAPLSEYYGRTPVYLANFFITTLLLLGTALVDNLPGFVVLRFITGFFASASITNIGGTIADMFHHEHTGMPLAIYTITSAGGSASGVFVFSFIAQLHGLHGVLWAMCGATGAFFLLLCLSLSLNETRHSVILRRRAARLRKETGNQNLDVPLEMRTQPATQVFATALTRPFHLLFTEPVILFTATYNGYLFGIAFLFNGAFTVVFSDGYGFNTIETGLANLGVCVGALIGPITHMWQERYYIRRVTAADGTIKNIPEARVQLSMVGSVVYPISLFWFAWSAQPGHIHWIVPMIASVFYGWSFYTIIQMTFMYIEDTYKVYAASALAGVCFARNMIGGTFPLFGTQMFNALGVHWAGSVLGFAAILLMPIPYVLGRYGRGLRRRSPWARVHMDDLGDEELAKM